jgi:FemAB-related protein (PEP-CTERM system-associated)
MATAAAIRPDIHVSRVDDAEMADTWPRAVDGLGGAHIAHAPAWFRAIRDSYGHDPLYLIAEDGEGRYGVLPAFIVRRPVGGTVVSSMPFLDGGGPCTSSPEVADALVARLMEEARGVGASLVELRCTERMLGGPEPMDHKVNLTLSLPSDATRLWKMLDGRVRNQVRKAERSGLSFELGGADKLDDFYPIFAARMHELGSPVHAPRFFAAVMEAFGGRARVAVVRKGSWPVGGLIALAFKSTLVVPWASCLRAYATSCPNMLLYWETIRTACGEGFRRFEFGRSTRGSGTYRFKRQWGAEEEPLPWYTFPSRGPGGADSWRGRGASLLTGSWRRLPLAVTVRLGPRIRRYLTQ